MFDGVKGFIVVHKCHIEGNRCLLCFFHYYSKVEYLIFCPYSFPKAHLNISYLLVCCLLHSIQQSQNNLTGMVYQCNSLMLFALQCSCNFGYSNRNRSLSSNLQAKRRYLRSCYTESKATVLQHYNCLALTALLVSCRILCHT